jgi:hypothetical protein
MDLNKADTIDYVSISIVIFIISAVISCISVSLYEILTFMNFQ